MKHFYLAMLSIGLSAAAPPKEMPKEYHSRFTMGGKADLLHWYLDGTKSGENARSFFAKSKVDENILKIQQRQSSYYGQTDLWLYDALEKHPIRGKEVLIIGSETPWYESVVIAYGGYPTTVEYNDIATNDPRLRVMTVEEFKKHPKQFDVLLSISSIEHDGLGRYGDPINPDADLEFMEKAASTYLKEDGVMYLAVPVGKDCIYWNACRVYGNHRLPLLFKHWKVVDHFGFDERFLFGQLGHWNYQPIFFLKPRPPKTS